MVSSSEKPWVLTVGEREGILHNHAGSAPSIVLQSVSESATGDENDWTLPLQNSFLQVSLGMQDIASFCNSSI